MRKALAVCTLLLTTLFAAVSAQAQSDVTPPVLVSVTVEPAYIDTSQSAQTLTVTAHITDDLSGCPESDWCADFFFQPIDGPDSQQRSNTWGYYNRIAGTATDGVYQATITLPRYSAQGEWRLTRFAIGDNVQNNCWWNIRSASSDPCTFPAPSVSFLNGASPYRKLRLPLLMRSQ